MSFASFRQRMAAGAVMAGTFQKTPSHEVTEVLARSGLDFVCLDAEHAPFDRARMDACLAIARAMDFPALVRVAAGRPEEILQALDMGAVGVVVPHVTDAGVAAAVAKAARFGHGGRGYAGSSRWAGFATRAMAENLAQSRAETVVIAQIEDPEAVEVAGEIAATEGIDGLFLGPADLSVAYGKTDQGSDELVRAVERVGAAAKFSGKAYMSFVPNPQAAQAWREAGMTMFFLASDHTWMLNGARAAAEGIRELAEGHAPNCR